MNNLKSKHILIVDDEKLMRDLLFRSLQSTGCKLSVAEDGVEGLEALEKVHTDVLISDIRMPKMDGIEFVREALSRHSHLTALLVTGFSDRISRRDAQDMGVADLIIKPFKNVEIIHSLRKALSVGPQLRSRKKA